MNYKKNILKMSLFFTISCVFFIASCSPKIYQDNLLVSPKLNKKWQSESNTKNFANLKSQLPRQWWKSFNDVVLNELTDLVHARNLNLKTAVVRILQARALLGTSKSQLYPTVNLNGTVNRSRVSGNSNLSHRPFTNYQTGFDAAWELDLWGRVRSQVKRDKLVLASYQQDYQNILLSITAEVANIYINYIVRCKQIDLIKENIALQNKSLKIAQTLFEEGLKTALDVEQAKAILAETKSTMPDLVRSKKQLKNALSTLLVMPSSEVTRILNKSKKEIPTLSKKLAIGAPIDLLRRRPDIQQAEISALAAMSQAKVAYLNQYPKFTLSGAFNFELIDGIPTLFNGNTGDLFNKNSLGLNIGPSVTIPIFNARRLRNLFLSADADVEKALITYQQAILQGVQDVENSITALVQSKKRFYHLKNSVTAYKKSYQIAKNMYKEGTISFQRIIDSQRQLILQQQEQLAEYGNTSLAQVSLIKALGGSWHKSNRVKISPTIKKALIKRSSKWKKYLK